MRLLLLLYPWLELLSIIQLGVESSALFAMFWVLGMFVLGGAMIRYVGTASVMRLREAQRTGVLQQSLLVDDMAVVIAGLLLIIPGLLSDFFAVVVLIGPLRRVLARSLFKASATKSVHAEHTVFSHSRQGYPKDGAHPGEATGHSHVVLEGEYQRIDDSTSTAPDSDPDSNSDFYSDNNRSS